MPGTTRRDESGIERRGFRRHVLDDRGRLRLDLSLREDGVSCTLGDVSATGVKVVIASAAPAGLEPGAVARLRCPDGGSVPAEIVHVTGDEVGLRFQDSWRAAVFWYGRILGTLRRRSTGRR